MGKFFAKNSGKRLLKKEKKRGEVKKNIISIVLWVIALLIFLLLIWLIFFFRKSVKVFRNIPIDPYVEKYADMSEGDVCKISLKFSEVMTFVNGKSKYIVDNIPDSLQTMVISVQITDQELNEKIGRTGRTSDEQQLLFSSNEYDPTNSRVTVSQCGGIPPGHKLQMFHLSGLPDGTKLPEGKYKGILKCDFYSISNGDKSLIDTQFPVLVVVKTSKINQS